MKNPEEYWMSEVEKSKKNRKFEDTIKILDKIKKVKKDKLDDDFWYHQAEHFYEIKEYEQAFESVQKDLKINKKYESFFMLGKILYKLKKYEGALESFNKALEEKNTEQLRNTLKIGQMTKVKKFEKAIQYVDIVNKNNSIDEEYWLHKGKILAKLKKYEDASICFRNALNANKQKN